MDGGSDQDYPMEDLSSSDADSSNDRESDEDTEDASETDFVIAETNEPAIEMKEQMYKDKRRALLEQLNQLQNGKHPDFIKRLKKLEAIYQERLLFNEACKEYEIERIEGEYQNEKLAAVHEFEERKIELKENLVAELEEKKRFIELERQNMDLISDFVEHKPITTRKLRRRPNEPVPMPQKGRRPAPQGGLNLVLEDFEVNEDLRLLARSTNSKSSSSNKRDKK